MHMNRNAFIALLLLNLITTGFFPRSADAAGGLKYVEITRGINQKRPAQNPQTIGRRYVWNFQGQSYTVLMAIEVERYNGYTSKQRYNIPKMVAEGVEAVADLIREFDAVLRKNPGWSNTDRVNFVLGFVQSWPYTLDDVTTGYDEFRRFAIETLIEGGGDCEDTTILAGAILSGLGERTALVTTPGHIALGVSGNFKGDAFTYSGAKYFYCETTGTGWTVGDLPASVGKRGQIVPLTIGSVPPKPEPIVIGEPDPVKPTPEPTTPTPEPVRSTPEPVKPTPEPMTPAPEPPRRVERSNSAAGAAVVIVLLLAAIAGVLIYLAIHFLGRQSRPEYETSGGSRRAILEANDPLHPLATRDASVGNAEHPGPGSAPRDDDVLNR